jgi:endonuclease G
MQTNDLDQSNMREAIRRARADNVKEKIQALSAKEIRPLPSAEQIEHRLDTLTKQVGNRDEAARRLERILKGDDLTDIKYLLQGVLCARSICRIVVHTEGASPSYGTGFLVAPGVLMTNYHVLGTESDVQVSSAEFNYELDLQGQHLAPTTFTLRTDPKPILCQEFDLAIAAVEPRSQNGRPVEQFSWLPLSAQPGKAFIGEYLTIIQHPRGEPKQVCVRENKVLTYSGTGPYIWYQTDTDSGSSGSPVFNNAWEVVALHHCSIPNTDDKGQMLTWDGTPVDRNTDSEEVAWIANEGVRISRIVEYLQGLGPHPLARQVLTAADPPVVKLPAVLGMTTDTSTSMGSGARAGEIQVLSDSDGVTRILVPVEITMKVNVGGMQLQNTGPASLPATPPILAAPDIPPTVPPAELTPPAEEGGFEKVVVNQMNYEERNGFNPNFLGEGLVVPLPKVTDHAEKTIGRVLRFKAGKQGEQKDEHELRYWNYSVVMNQDRKLAYFSAANVNSDTFTGERDAAGDTWYEDTRIPSAFQLSGKDKFYGDPFDKGHLTSRSDLQWWYIDAKEQQSQAWLKLTEKEKEARKTAIAKQYGDDSFHWTNCSPQHGAFNRASTKNGLWRRLELAAINDLSTKNVKKFCIINGSVFDAPGSFMQTVDGVTSVKQLNLEGAPEKDVSYRNVQIPKLFFKVIAYSVKSQAVPGKLELRAKAFVVSQENLLNRKNIEDFQEKFTSEEINVYEVTIPALQKLTGLDFGTLSRRDWIGKEESFTQDMGTPVEINDESELVF